MPVKGHNIEVIKAPITISAFLSESITYNILKRLKLSKFELVLLPGFVQWNTAALENEFNINLRKGPEFASELPFILKNIEKIELSTTIPANKLFESSGEKFYKEIVKEKLEIAKNNLDHHTFYLNENTSNLIIGRNLPPPIIAEIVNCTEKSNETIIKKVKHYIESGADIIDIGCIANKPNPERTREIIELIRSKFNILLSIDSMDLTEINTAVDSGIDLILSLDLGNYKKLTNLPKEISIVILPTNLKETYFPKDPETRVKNLFKLTNELQGYGFKKLIADPLLETPIVPGICNSLEAYFLYKKEVVREKNQNLELPLFFGVSNVVELMDIDSVGINGLLASIAVELDIGVLFTVEHSTKLMGGVSELMESIKLNYISKCKKTPPINQGLLGVFKAKGKTAQKQPKIEENEAIHVNQLYTEYIPDKRGYFKIYLNHYTRNIYVLYFSIEHILVQTFIGTNAEALCKKIIELNITDSHQHINYLGREISKAEQCLLTGKPYIQDV